jgi:hypothetical protein
MAILSKGILASASNSALLGEAEPNSILIAVFFVKALLNFGYDIPQGKAGGLQTRPLLAQGSLVAKAIAEALGSQSKGSIDSLFLRISKIAGGGIGTFFLGKKPFVDSYTQPSSVINMVNLAASVSIMPIMSPHFQAPKIMLVQAVHPKSRFGVSPLVVEQTFGINILYPRLKFTYPGSGRLGTKNLCVL